MQRFRNILLIFVSITFFQSNLFSKGFVLSKDFTLFTSRNLEGYLKPIFTTLEQSLNNSLFGTSLPDGKFRFTLNLSVCGMIIPDEHKSFDAEVPPGFFDSNAAKVAQYRNGEIYRYVIKPNIQPTIYGGSSTPIFSAPQNHNYPDSTYKTIAYPEGLHIDFMAGLPVLQSIIETPLRNEIRFRIYVEPTGDETFVYFTIGLNQRFDHLFDLFGLDKDKALSFHFALHRMYWGDFFDLTSYALGINAMQRWGNLCGYLGFQFENMNGFFKAIRDTTGFREEIVDSPFPELREARPIIVSLSTFTKFQLKGGFTLSFLFGFLNLELSFATQPMISAGFGLFIGKNRYEK